MKTATHKNIMRAIGVGPWEVIKSSRPHIAGDFFVARRVGSNSSHYEQLRDSDGDLRRFETETHAVTAISEL